MDRLKRLQDTTSKFGKFIIVPECGKKGTEVDYFNRVKELVSREVGPLITFHNPQNSEISEILKCAEECNLEKKDKIFIIIDNDRLMHDKQHTEKLQKILDWSKKEPSTYFLCLSNPSFELWILLHFEKIKSYSQQNIKRLLKKHKVMFTNGRSKRVNTKLISKGKIEAAIKNARNITSDYQSPRSNYGTGVFLAVEEIFKTDQKMR